MNSIKFLLLFAAIFISTNNYSQNRKKINKNRVKAHKIAFITDQLNLTAKEAEVFWPIYNAHEKLLSQYRKEEIKVMEPIMENSNRPILSSKNFDKINESEAGNMYNLATIIRNKIHQENERFFTQIATVLNYKKLLKLQIAEREFRKELFRKLRQLNRRLEDN